jgi:small subunit ribosomal protein S17
MNTRRRLTGIVSSDKMMKTVLVEVTRSFRHPLYRKVVHSTSRFMAHDELGCQVGDVVRIVESRPLSRRKCWVVETIVRRAAEGTAEAQAQAEAEAEYEKGLEGA